MCKWSEQTYTKTGMGFCVLFVARAKTISGPFPRSKYDKYEALEGEKTSLSDKMRVFLKLWPFLDDLKRTK